MKAEIWTKPGCSYCEKAKMLFKNRSIDYDEVIIGLNESATVDLAPNQRVESKEALLEKVPNARTVPQIWLDGNYVGGYTELAAFLGIAA